MGSGVSTLSEAEALNAIRADATGLDLSAADVDTPRGQTAKDEVKKLRLLMVERQQAIAAALAQARFNELDTDKSGFLERDELIKVAEWVMGYFGTKMGADKASVLEKIMKRLDHNKDNKLDIEEFTKLFTLIVARNDLVARAKAKFAELDKDSSGFLEAAEIDETVTWTLQAFPNDADLQTYKKQLMANIDSNGDGKLDLDEFIILFEDLMARLELIERARSKFSELDVDKSGVLENAEIDKVCEWVLAAYGEKTEVELAGFKATLMKRIDVNADGKISLPEFAVIFEEICTRMDLIHKAKKAFNDLDKDKSGFLEKEELGKVLILWAESCGEKIGINPSQPLEELLAKLDANSDGKLSAEEFMPLFEDVTSVCGMWAAAPK